MTFSSKSDVWSYGVTLWEIFSLGEIPFPGGFTWNSDFLTQLLNGMRMAQPPNSTNEMLPSVFFIISLINISLIKLIYRPFLAMTL